MSRLQEETSNCAVTSGPPAYQVLKVKDDGGRVNGVLIDPATGFRLGGADPRENGYAIGW